MSGSSEIMSIQSSPFKVSNIENGEPKTQPNLSQVLMFNDMSSKNVYDIQGKNDGLIKIYLFKTMLVLICLHFVNRYLYFSHVISI